jgi:hypothetical protein
MSDIKLLDVVALLEDAPAEGLKRGEVGTVVEVFADQSGQPPGAVLVEFSDRTGAAYAFVDLRADQLMKLHYRDAAQEAA